MDINLLAISECISLYYEVLAIMTYQCNTQNCLKVKLDVIISDVREQGFLVPVPVPVFFLYSLRYNIQGCSEVEKIRTVDDFFENF